jgi:cystathionine beta-lyase
MNQQAFDFETVVDRRDIGNMKYLVAPKAIKDAGMVSFSGAEADFKTAPVIIEAMVRKAENGLMGFTLCDETYKNAVKWWMRTQRDWEIQDEWIVPTYGTIFSVSTAIRAFTDEGDGIIVQPPIYNRYEQAIRRNNRRVVYNPLKQDETGYKVDLDNLEDCMKDPRNKMLIVCNPHNPIGRVWNVEELKQVSYLANKYNVIIFSDEIFAEIVFDGNITVPYAKVAEENSIVSTSLGKTFNFTGVNNANITIMNESIRQRFIQQRNADHYGSIDPMAHAAICAAYSPQGAEWVLALLEHLRTNLKTTRDFFERYLPQVKLYPTQGTYLIWQDWRGLGLGEDELHDFLVNEALLDLSPGRDYGAEGPGFTRMSVATTRYMLQKALDNLFKAIKKRGF